MESVNKVSRRGFVEAAAVGGLAVASLGSAKGALADEQTMAGPQILYVPEVPEAWDLEAEIVVLGSGIAGSCAAVEAYDLGMDVLLVTAVGGITECDCTLSGGSLAGCGTELQEAAGIEDDVEVMVKDILRCGGEMNDPDVIRAWATEKPLTGSKSLGVRFLRPSLTPARTASIGATVPCRWATAWAGCSVSKRQSKNEI